MIKSTQNHASLSEWQALSDHYVQMKDLRLRESFAKDPTRFPRFTLSAAGLFLDYSRNLITDDTIKHLCKLAEASQLSQKIAALFNGESINITEKRPALHVALRDQHHTPITINDENIALLIENNLARMKALTTKIHAKEWLGVTGKPIQHIVNVGIGGSHLGPMMCTQALKDFAKTNLSFHFISSVDRVQCQDVLAEIDPEAALFLISSKSFSTIETLTNANTLLKWMRERYGNRVIASHFLAITASENKALAWGMPKENIFPLWDWVGGRYSIWSAIGLPLMLMIGADAFFEFLAGAHQMDQHFKHAEFSQNMPVLLALLSIWYCNFFEANVQAIAPYSHRLRHLVAYLQQAEMESNGKSIHLSGTEVDHSTGMVIFGDEGCSGQHAYHQLLHQGHYLIPVDFILHGQAQYDQHYEILLASGLSQAQALMRGKTYEEAYAALIAKNYTTEEATLLAKHQMIPGNRPSNILFLPTLSPHSLGALLALYEHKIFVQGVIWDINSFDQWGVELGKQLLPAIIQAFKNHDYSQQDPATAGFIQHLQRIRSST